MAATLPVAARGLGAFHNSAFVLGSSWFGCHAALRPRFRRIGRGGVRDGGRVRVLGTIASSFGSVSHEAGEADLDSGRA